MIEQATLSQALNCLEGKVVKSFDMQANANNKGELIMIFTDDTEVRFNFGNAEVNIKFSAHS